MTDLLNRWRLCAIVCQDKNLICKKPERRESRRVRWHRKHADMPRLDACVSQELLRKAQPTEGEAAEFGVGSFVYRCSCVALPLRVFQHGQPLICSVLPTSSLQTAVITDTHCPCSC